MIYRGISGYFSNTGRAQIHQLPHDFRRACLTL